MKHLPIAAALLTATTAHAGGLSQPINEPRPTARPTVGVAAYETGWAGGYGGLSFNNTTVTTDVPDMDVYACESSDYHGGVKCWPKGHGDSPEIAALDRVSKPWNLSEYRLGQQFGDPVIYGEEPALWMPVDSRFEYTVPAGSPYTTQPGKNASITLVDTITETVTEAECWGAFAGYGFDLAPNVVGRGEVDASCDLRSFQGHLGMTTTNVLIYVLAGVAQYEDPEMELTHDGYVYGGGADLRVSERMFFGGKYTVGDFGNTQTETLGLRVGWSF